MDFAHDATRHSHSHLIGFARAVWSVLALLAIAILIASVPGYISVAVGGVGDWPAVAGFPQHSFAINLAIALASFTSALVSLVLAGTLFLRKSDDGMALFVSFFLLLYGIVMAGPMEMLEVYFPGMQALTMRFQTVLLTLPTMLFMALFPSGRFVPRWTGWLIPFSIVWVPLIFLLPPFNLSFSLTPVVLLAGFAWVLSLPGLGLFAQIYRYRNVSSPGERQQTKWVVFGFLLWIFLLIPQSVLYVYLLLLPRGAPLPVWAPAASFVWSLSLNIVPLCMTVAVLRHRLWEVDLFINRALVYGAVTGTLAVIYFGAVITLQQVLPTQSQITVVISTLAIAALFSPLRRRIQEEIDRRFYRRKYDARQTLAGFGASIRDHVDLDHLSESLLTVVEESVQPAHVSLWLRAPKSRRNRNARALSQ